MGVKGLYKLIAEHASGCIEERKTLRGLKIAIDASWMIYQTYSVGETRGLVNSQGKNVQHLRGLYHKINNITADGAVIVFVFDGAPPASKSGTLEARKASRDAGTSIRVPREVFDQVKKLLDAMSIPWVDAPGEGEVYAAVLCRAGYVNAVMSDDADCLAFGTPLLVRKLPGASMWTIYDHAKLLELLKMTQPQFVDLCILLGTDYCGKLPRVGPATALKIIKTHGSIAMYLTAHPLPTDVKFDYNIAQVEFATPNTTQVSKLDLPDKQEINMDETRKLLEIYEVKV